MKPLVNPQDQKKAIGLVVGVVLVFGFVIKNTMSALSGGAPPPTQPVEVVGGSNSGSAPSTVITATLPAGTEKPADSLIDPPVFLASETPNPFHKDTDSYNAPISFSNAITTEVTPPKERHLRNRNSDTGSGFVGRIKGQIPDVGGGVVIQKDPDPLTCSGVITGQNPVAVIRVGATEYVVDKGGRFGRGYRLKEVSESQVVVEQGGELHMLRVGARPPSAPAATSSTPPPAATTAPPPDSNAVKAGGSS